MDRKISKNAITFGYKIIEDNSVKELRLPTGIIDLLSRYVNDLDLSKEELIPNKFWTCGKCGFKMPALKNKSPDMFSCPKDMKKLFAH